MTPAVVNDGRRGNAALVPGTIEGAEVHALVRMRVRHQHRVNRVCRGNELMLLLVPTDHRHKLIRWDGARHREQDFRRDH
jgi:hypothetical protein